MNDRRLPEAGEEADLIVERLLSGALSTPALDEQRCERLRSAVMKEWRAVVPAATSAASTTRLWRWIGVAAGASLVAVALATLLTIPAGKPALFGSLVRLNDGDIEMRSGWFRSQTLQVGDALRVGERLQVHGPTLVTLAGGGTLRIGAGSRLSIAAATELSLERGLIYLDMPPGSGSPNPLRVATLAGVIEHLGTQYEVMSDARAVRIRVREGQIRFSGTSGVVDASAGTELLALPDVPVTQTIIPTYGRDWLWTSALAPDYDIEGRSLIGFLHWASRELGRPLDFADSRSRDIADRTILHGSVRGQEPVDALANVLATTSLTYELRGDTIWVRSAAK